ncbi:ATP synthase delta chain [hydrothermal vent metagenome]|uniref:ATP synthase delta chain n=1 Tax=hydrothermal vent metagenome TaxID=652676 RepID=A0A1W1BT07_9ZZZZ
MMNELVAKKYVKALAKEFDFETLQNVSEVLMALAEALNDDKIKAVIYSPEVSKEKRSEILVAALSGTKSKEIENFIKLLVENNRVELVADIATVLQSYIANQKREFSGIVYSDSDIDEKILNELSTGLGKRFDSTIALSYVKSDFDGIKVEVDGLGVEISFSRSRISDQIVDHILKAI